MSTNLNGMDHGKVCSRSVHTIYIPEADRLSKSVTQDFILEAVTHLHHDGILILENAIDTSHLDTLNALLSKEAFELSRDPSHHSNFGEQTRNMDQAPPLTRDLMFDDVWNNHFAVAVLKAVLGGNVVCHYANGNTALQADVRGRQPVHSDIGGAHPLFPFAYAVNVPLVDMTPENGSTEIWVGSHRDSNVDQHVSPGYLPIRSELVEARRRRSPPIQPSTRKGSLILRDIRLWHAGMPNRVTEPRCMLAFVMQPKWFQAPSKVLLPMGVRGVVERWEQETGLEFCAEWVAGEVDHKKVKSNDVDFGSGSKRMSNLEHLMHLRDG
ncbi:phytanoyl-CoA dioxygenase family protein [Polychaeton citri CBS 116435]|uniref:Phytanoyl-CoA dioxygenase family protein n=1 Tax=Polychaeton citri CBS 116435 TaxID=1314669 RepID=A0A9P4QA81_9PEZI|nr:phytanoyl-CoA dioxygenase family protein [Polychaeton citri CBS 116435]